MAVVPGTTVSPTPTASVQADMYVNGRGKRGPSRAQHRRPGDSAVLLARPDVLRRPTWRADHAGERAHQAEQHRRLARRGSTTRRGNRWVWCGPGCTSTFGTWVPFSVGLSASRVAALADVRERERLDARNGLHGYAAIRDVSVVVADEGAPSVAIKGGGLVAAGWRRGVRELGRRRGATQSEFGRDEKLRGWTESLTTSVVRVRLQPGGSLP